MQGKTRLNGGVYHNQQWKESLPLKRISWYHQISMHYEVFIAEDILSTPFKQWLSVSEEKTIKNCPHFFYIFSYQMDLSEIHHSHFASKMQENSFKIIYLPNFTAELKAHPELTKRNLVNYKHWGFCSQTKDSATITFPGYRPVIIQ